MQSLKWYLQAGRRPAWFCVALLLGGCGSDIPSTSDTSGLTLSCRDFQTSVNQIFDADINGRTCAASGCHSVNGGSGGAFKIYPSATAGSLQMEANYLAARAFTNLSSVPDSKLLLEPLGGSQSIVGAHTGGDIFPDTTDLNYIAIRAWIANQIQGPSTCLP